MKRLFSISIFLFVFVTISFAQVTIAPTNLFIDSRTKFGSYLVINGSSQAQEITVDFVFGYIDSDSAGNRALIYEAPEKAQQYSAAEWVRAFPRNFTLQPGQRQTVRLRVQAPNDLQNGVYWSRIRTTATPLSPPVEDQGSDAVTARVGFKLEQVTGLYYKQGDVSTGITINDIEANKKDNGLLEVLTKVSRTGNAPFLGSVYATLYNSKNEEVGTSKISTTIFFDDVIRHEIDTSGLSSGNYKLQLRFESQRNDVPKEDLVQITPVSKSTQITL